MKIRPMRSDDVARVVEIAHSLAEAPRWTPQVYARATDPDAAPARIALVAETPDAGVVGFSIAVLIPPQAELETIAVAQTAQRQGIARRLLAELFDLLKPYESTEVMLEVRASNDSALALYASLGFSETGRRKGYYTDPKEDAILLGRPLV
jgi:ribosomal-protein-alanine N-acetyltransferase